MIKKIVKPDNYNVAYFPTITAHTISFAKNLQFDYNQEYDEELKLSSKIDNSIVLSKLCRGIEFYKSLSEKDVELFSKYILFDKYLIGDYSEPQSIFIKNDETLNEEFNRISDEEYLLLEKIDKSLSFPIFQRGIEFSKSLNEEPFFISHESFDLKIIKEFSDSYQSDISNLIKKDVIESETIHWNSILEFEKFIENKIKFSEFGRGIDFSLPLLEKGISDYDYDLLYDKELNGYYNQILIQEYLKIFKINEYEIFEIDSVFLSSLSSILDYSIKADTGLSFTKTKMCSLSVSFDNVLSLVNDLTFSSNFQSDIKSILTSTISFDDLYTLWKITSLSFSKNINFEYNQTQDFEIDLYIAQLFSKLITLTPSVVALRIALKEILTFIKQIEVLAISKQIAVTTTAKQIPILVTAQMA